MSKTHFGPYGGQYVAETLMPALHELEKAYSEAKSDPAFKAEMKALQLTSPCPGIFGDI